MYRERYCRYWQVELLHHTQLLSLQLPAVCGGTLSCQGGSLQKPLWRRPGADDGACGAAHLPADGSELLLPCLPLQCQVVGRPGVFLLVLLSTKGHCRLPRGHVCWED